MATMVMATTVAAAPPTPRIARRLAAGPTLSYAAIKQAINVASTSTLDQQLDLERAGQRELGRSADHREGVAAFLAKRAPVFGGK